MTAVDVSPTMQAALMARAAELGVESRVRPVLAADLQPAGEHDLAVSLLVLQHLSSPAEVRAALSSLVGSVRPGGYLVLEIPERAITIKARLQPRFHTYRFSRVVGLPPATLHAGGLSGISMLCLTRAWVTSELARHGAEVIGTPTARSDQAHSYVRNVARRAR